MEDRIVQPLECSEGDGLLSDREVEFHLKWKAPKNLPALHYRCEKKLAAQKQAELNSKH